MSHDLVMPHLQCPFPRREHPGAASAEKEILGWLTASGFTEDSGQLDVHRISRFGTFAAMTYPEAVGPEELALAGRWLAWLCVFDDRYLDETPAGADTTAMATVLISTLAVLTPPHIPATQVEPDHAVPDPLLDALRILVNDIAERAGHVQLERLINDVVIAMYGAYLDAGAWHAVRRVPDLPEYRVTRQYSGAVLACLSLIDIVSGYEVPAAEFSHPQVRALRGSARNIITWSNDVFSYLKEARRSQFDVNLPIVLQRHRGRSAQESLDQTARLHNEEVDTYLALQAEVTRWASPELIRYLDGLCSWMQGNHYWSLESGRYGLSAADTAAILGVTSSRTPA